MSTLSTNYSTHHYTKSNWFLRQPEVSFSETLYYTDHYRYNRVSNLLGTIHHEPNYGLGVGWRDLVQRLETTKDKTARIIEQKNSGEIQVSTQLKSRNRTENYK
jgi:hypothetical protein